MTTETARERYLTTLLTLAERHQGPLSDLAPVLERCDVLVGVDLQQKALPAGAPPEIQVVPPVIEHGAEAPESDEGSTVAEYSAPVVHEEAQQAPVSASAGAASDAVVPTPAAPSPGRVTNKTERPCGCGCGTVLLLFPYEIKAKPNGPYFVNRSHRSTWLRSDRPEAAAMRARLGSGKKPNRAFNPAVPTETPRPAPQEPLTPPAPVETPAEPARGLSDVVAQPPVEPAPRCYCAGYRAHVDGFRQDIANEAHAKNCPMYRVGGHKWPLPKQGQDEEPPYVVSCTWCGMKREVDRSGVEWSKSESNPAVGDVNRPGVPRPSREGAPA